MITLPNPLQNAQQHQHTHTHPKKNHVCRFHYPLYPMCEIKILKPLQINENDPFSQQYSNISKQNISIFKFFFKK
jgi:hypothetical protein